MKKNVNGVDVPMTDAEIAEYNALQAATAVEMAEGVLNRARAERDDRLVKDVDPIVSNPFRWDVLTAAKQAEWTQYRTDLLNVPDQAGFPDDITWPTKPE
jgi:hypothetical protein